MEIKYDELANELFIFFSHEKPHRSVRVNEDSVVWYAESGKFVYLQIRKASKYVDNMRGIQFDVIPKDAPPAGYIIVGGDAGEDDDGE